MKNGRIKAKLTREKCFTPRNFSRIKFHNYEISYLWNMLVVLHSGNTREAFHKYEKLFFHKFI